MSKTFFHSLSLTLALLLPASHAAAQTAPTKVAILKNLTAWFDKHDLDKDGFLDRAELANAFGYASTWREIKKVVPKAEEADKKEAPADESMVEPDKSSGDSKKPAEETINQPKDSLSEKNQELEDYSKRRDYILLAALDTSGDDKISRPEFNVWADDYATKLADYYAKQYQPGGDSMPTYQPTQPAYLFPEFYPSRGMGSMGSRQYGQQTGKGYSSGTGTTGANGGTGMPGTGGGTSGMSGANADKSMPSGTGANADKSMPSGTGANAYKSMPPGTGMTGGGASGMSGMRGQAYPPAIQQTAPGTKPVKPETSTKGTKPAETMPTNEPAMGGAGMTGTGGGTSGMSGTMRGQANPPAMGGAGMTGTGGGTSSMSGTMRGQANPPAIQQAPSVKKPVTSTPGTKPAKPETSTKETKPAKPAETTSTDKPAKNNPMEKSAQKRAKLQAELQKAREHVAQVQADIKQAENKDKGKDKDKDKLTQKLQKAQEKVQELQKELKSLGQAKN